MKINPQSSSVQCTMSCPTVQCTVYTVHTVDILQPVRNSLPLYRKECPRGRSRHLWPRSIVRWRSLAYQPGWVCEWGTYYAIVRGQVLVRIVMVIFTLLYFYIYFFYNLLNIFILLYSLHRNVSWNIKAWRQISQYLVIYRYSTFIHISAIENYNI